MSGLDCNFSFGGKHCLADWGLVFVRDGERSVMTPGRTRSYTISGVHGEPAFGQAMELESYDLTGTLYAVGDLQGEEDAQRLWRAVSAWLGNGRQRLVWDYEPERYIEAEVTAMEFDEFGWVDGGCRVVFRCQPGFRGLYPQRLQLNLDGGGRAVGTFRPSTGMAAPVDLMLRNTGLSVITACYFSVGSQSAAIDRGLALQPGERLGLQMAHPAGVRIEDGAGQGRDGLRHVSRMAPLEAAAPAAVAVTVVYGGAGGRAEAEVSCRGVWR